MLKPALNPVDTHFEALWQDLPLELVDSAREFRAFSRARKIKTPQELLRVVLLYCGLDQSLRTVAGNLRQGNRAMSVEVQRLAEHGNRH